jgi:hypothetical protein
VVEVPNAIVRRLRRICQRELCFRTQQRGAFRFRAALHVTTFSFLRPVGFQFVLGRSVHFQHFHQPVRQWPHPPRDYSPRCPSRNDPSRAQAVDQSPSESPLCDVVCFDRLRDGVEREYGRLRLADARAQDLRCAGQYTLAQIHFLLCVSANERDD